METKIHDQEVLLQKLWKSRKLFSRELRTLNGERIEVIFAGIENLDAGPDFKDAVIKIAGRLFKGDIEVHLDELGWYEHGHHTDPRYNNVILHLISGASTDKKFIEREDGAPVHQVCVDTNEQKVSLWKNDGPSKTELQVAVVENCPLRATSASKIMETINGAGHQRLAVRAEQLREDLLGMSWDNLIYRKIMEALGYSKNQAPFSKLAELVPFEMVGAEMQWVDDDTAMLKSAALLFGAAGLLPSQSSSGSEALDASTLSVTAALEQHWEPISHRLELKAMKPQAWQFFRLRPQNFPTRRLAGMLQLVRRFHRLGFLHGFLKIFESHQREPNLIINELENVMSVKAEGYWHNHYRFGEERSDSERTMPEALIGKDRARDIVVNIVLPVLYLYSRESNDGMLKSLVREIYSRFPKLSENSITRVMREQIFERGGVEPKVQFAYQQQGLIYLNKLYCRPLRCSECLLLTESS
jgi:hypothetical protein